MNNNKNRIIRTVFSVVTALLFQLNFQLNPFMIVQMVFLFLLILIYIIPQLKNLVLIKNYNIKTVKPLIIDDLIFQIIPSVLTVVFAEAAFLIFGSNDVLDGLGSIIFIVTAILLNSIFWLIYYIKNKIYK